MCLKPSYFTKYCVGRVGQSSFAWKLFTM